METIPQVGAQGHLAHAIAMEVKLVLLNVHKVLHGVGKMANYRRVVITNNSNAFDWNWSLLRSLLSDYQTHYSRTA